MRARPIAVLVVDDQAAFPAAARAVLALSDEFAVVGEARSVADAIEVLRRRPVDLVLMDLHMEPVDGVSGARRVLAAAAPPVVVLCSATPAAELPPLPADLDVSFLAKEELDPETLLAAWLRHRRR